MDDNAKRIAERLRVAGHKCIDEECDDCMFNNVCDDKLFKDAAGLIEELSARAEAAERDIALAQPCEICANSEECDKIPCYCCNGSAFVWRGSQEGETNESNDSEASD